MSKLERKDLVSIHACERFATRIMGMEIEPGQLNFSQIKALTDKIISIAKKCHPEIFNVGVGCFKCGEFDCTLVLQEGTIVTVKKLEPDRNPDYVGGIHKSGCKKKKLKWKARGNNDVDLNSNNNRYPFNNGNRYDKKSKRKSLKEF